MGIHRLSGRTPRTGRALCSLRRAGGVGDLGVEKGMKKDVKTIAKALRDANATAVQLKMASILLRERGLESALEFIDKICKETPETLHNGERGERE